MGTKAAEKRRICGGAGMIYLCTSCGCTFSRDDAIKEHYIGGETEYFCPNCGSDDLEKVTEDEAEGTAD